MKDRVALTRARVDVEDHVMEKGCNWSKPFCNSLWVPCVPRMINAQLCQSAPEWLRTALFIFPTWPHHSNKMFYPLCVTGECSKQGQHRGIASSSHCQPPLQVPANPARRSWPLWPVVMPSQPWSCPGTAGWLSAANQLQMEFNTGVCREAVQESFPDVVKCLQLPAKLLGAFKTAFHGLENVYRGNQKARTFIHVWLLSVRLHPFLGLRLFGQVGCKEDVQSLIRQLVQESLWLWQSYFLTGFFPK